MINIEYLADGVGAQKFGTCVSCGKGSKEDPKMVRVTYVYHEGKCSTTTCLCDECRKMLLGTVRGDDE